MFCNAPYKNIERRYSPATIIFYGLLMIAFASLPAHSQFIHQISYNGSKWSDEYGVSGFSLQNLPFVFYVGD